MRHQFLRGIYGSSGAAGELSDPDAIAYVTAVEAADGQALELDTAIAYEDFIVGCKTDGIWSAIQASCILAGARTLNGALVPLAGAAPTNNNFVSGDYSRTTGLKGNASNKYLNANRTQETDPVDNCHLAIYVTEAASPGTRMYIGGVSHDIYVDGSDLRHRNRQSLGANTQAGEASATGFMGSSRASTTNYDFRSSGSTINELESSNVASSPIYVFARGTGSLLATDGRMTFYSIGEALDLALLDARLVTLMSDLAAAIP